MAENKKLDKDTQKILNTTGRLLWACKKIMDCNSETIKILQRSTLSNVRAIERNSRSIKDPNPLMSTMTNINLKYPITFRRDAINTNIIPKELICLTADNRRYNRVMCKTDLVQWYIHDHEVEQDETVVLAINKLFESNRKRLDVIFSYPWESAKFKIGDVSLSRVLIPVNPNDIDIPKALVKPAILNALGLSNLVEYDNVPEYYLEQIRKIIVESNLDVRKIPNLLNFIQAQVDPRFRFLPTITGLTPEYVYISHAIIQPQYRVTNIMEMASSKLGHNTEITMVCMNLIAHCTNKSIDFNKIKGFVHSIKINDYPFIKLIEVTDENRFTKFIKGLVGFKISPLIERCGVKYYPQSTSLLETMHESADGIPFRRLNGEELVYFESSISKGFFKHNADSLLQISINRTTMKELIFMRSNIAVFLTLRFEFFKGNTLRRVRETARKYYQSHFLEVVRIEEENLHLVINEISSETNEDAEMGLLRFSDNIEIIISDPETGLLIGEEIRGSKTNQVLSVLPICEDIVKVSNSVKISDPSLYYLMSPTRFLSKIIQFNLNMIGKIKKNIIENKFTPANPILLTKYVPVSQQNGLSNHLKKVLTEMVLADTRNDLFISVFYNFTRDPYIKVQSREVNQFLFDKKKVLLSLKGGILEVDPSGNLKMEGEIIINAGSKFREEDEAQCAILPKFSIRRVNKLIKGIDIKSLQWLRDNEDLVAEGYKAITIFQTGYFLATKRNDVSLLKKGLYAFAYFHMHLHI